MHCQLSLAGYITDSHIAFVGLRFKDQSFGVCFFVTTCFHEHRRLGDTTGVYDALADSLRYYLDKYSALLPAYVFMPTHLHLLLMIDGDRLSPFMRDFKKFVAQKGIQQTGVISSKVWEPRFDRVIIQSEVIFLQKMEYIHRNPVKAGLVERDEDWLWSSAPAYRKGTQQLVPIWTNWSV
jgi:putative transposase